MKKLFLICTAIGFLAACNSNKKSTNAGLSSQKTSGNATATTNNSNSVNQTNKGTVTNPAESKTHLDSLMGHSGGGTSNYNHREGNFKGASGAGTGGSYAGAGYAQARYKRKYKPKTKRTFDAPLEQEQKQIVNKTIDSTEVKNVSTNMTTNGDSTNMNNEISNFENSTDSSSFSKRDSTNLNSGW